MTSKAILGAGCFWGVEATFRQVPGVVNVSVGYSGGTLANPSYEDVCYRNTGHAEVVLVEFDPARLTYEQLLDVFWGAHDPTQKNRQGPDIGTQYRSAIFVFDEEQAEAARAAKDRLDASGRFVRPIATEITPASSFWQAEEYHQRYLEKRGLAGCHLPS
jgi:peptide-methionine (S)-S-oxide reductase